MAENKFSGVCGNSKETVCIETNRVLDSCRDRDCYEYVKVYLSNFGNEILERTSAIRAKCAEIMWANIAVDPIQFNRGFYSVTIRFYIKVTFEACVGGGRSQELEGITVIEKRVILYGGESGVNVFRSNGESGGFCSCPEPTYCSSNLPTAVVELVDPVLLGTKIFEKASECKPCCCCCREEDIPEHVMSSMGAPICFDVDDHDGRILTVSLGVFSVIRIVRPAQYLITASECAIPEKECISVEEDDPCRVFRTMPFPFGEFTQGSGPHHDHGSDRQGDRSDRCGRCGC